MPELTPEEASFFETGELPESMVEEAAAAAAALNPTEPPHVEEPPKDAPIVSAPDVPVGDTVAAIERLLAANEAMSQKLEALAQQVAQKQSPAAPPEVVPDENEDPLGAMLHKLNLVNSQVAALKTDLTTEQQNNLLRQQFDQFTASVTKAKETFETTTPDFKEAYAHIRALRTEDLRAAGCPEKDINQILINDEFQLAQTAIQRGKNPAAEMYSMAKRYGYTTKAAPKAPAAQQTPEQKLEALRAGQRAAKNPDKAGSESVLTLDGLKDASSDDLNALVQDDKAWQRIMGGKSKDIF